MVSQLRLVERWAFAFSIKKKWRDKIKADVENIISTKRPYKRIYFITNQYAPERQRAEREDTLTASSGIAVTILDRSWILDKVYKNDLVELAVRALNMTGYSEALLERAGPRDTARQLELERLDAAVADPDRYKGAPYALAEDALQSALLARGLERSRHEVEGRFQAAVRIAADGGHNGQRLRIAYHRAWTTHWWFQDYSLFNRLYDEVAEFALASDSACDLELVTTLWQLLLTAVTRKHLTEEKARTEARGAALRAALEGVADNVERPNNAAEARTSLAVMQVPELMLAGRLDDLPGVWDELRTVIGRIEGLGSYPVERVYEFVARLGELVPESEAFDALYDELVNLIERRRSEAEGGVAYLRRGIQKLDKKRYYEAIRMLGRAETRLIKDEYFDELVETLVAIGQAYRQVDLRWASRAKILLAAERLLVPFERDGRLDGRAAVPLRALVWLDLELGRVPQALSAIELYRVVAASSDQPEEIAVKIPEELRTMEAVLGILLLRANPEQLYALERAPSMLGRRGFPLASGALVWALGGTAAIRRVGFAPPEESDHEIAEYFDRWARQPAADDLPPRPTLAETSDVSLRSVIVGVEVEVRAACNADSILLGEAILAALESFLSTSLGTDAIPYREKMELSIRPCEDRTAAPSFKIDEEARDISVVHGIGEFAGAGDYPAFCNWLRDLLIRLTLNIMVIPDPERWLDRIVREEVALGRALALAGVAGATLNIFGRPARLTLPDWIDLSDPREPLTVKTSTPLASEAASHSAEAKDAPRFGEGQAPEIVGPEAGGHADIRVRSPINIPLWDRAGWKGVGFSWGGNAPPILMPIFSDYEAGKAIFREWRKQYGASDDRDALRFAIIRGIDRTDPPSYAMIISSEVDFSAKSTTKYFMTMRIHRMNPQSTQNLDTFLRPYGANAPRGRASIIKSSLGRD